MFKRKSPSSKRDIRSLPAARMTELLVLLREVEEQRSNGGKKRTPRYLEMM